MKSRRTQKAAALSAGFLLCVLFQNGSRVNWEEATLEKVDLTIRNSHARELLGSSYRKSAARFHEGNRDLSREILAQVRQNLPKSYGKQAGALTRAILSESKKHGFDPLFVMAVIQTESKWNPVAIGGVGEIGLMQIRPETAEWMANRLKMKWDGAESLKKPATNVVIGVAYMAYLRGQMGKNSMKYVSAYNMGAKNVRRLLAQKIRPAEYRSKVLTNYEELYRALPAQGHTVVAASI